MTFKEALKKLNIEDYGERILNSNSHGELFHLADYVFLAELFDTPESRKDFREWFVAVVNAAYEKWDRPASVFQHIIPLLQVVFKGGGGK